MYTTASGISLAISATASLRSFPVKVNYCVPKAMIDRTGIL